ncbi:cytochrome P450 [Streptomyces sp. NPDC045470]|uniref:cytochrome P450 n=1 Tax=Streptomyces sp. NPDC045470 TaxID=3155469 RepID=UPI0033F4C0EF
MKTAGKIIGALMSAEGKTNPYPIYREARELGPVTRIAPDWFLVSTFAEVREAMRSSAYLKNRYSNVDENQQAVRRAHRSIQLFDESVLLKDAPEHGRMRKVLGEAFTPGRIAAMAGKIQQVVDEVLDSLAERASAGEVVDFMEEFAIRVPLTVICDLMGVPWKDWSRFRPLAVDLNATLEMLIDDTQLATADAAAAELDEYFSALIECRRAAPQDDLVSVLLTAADGEDGQLDSRELLANLELLLVAGFETTTNLLGNALAVLFDHPEVHGGLLAGKYTYAQFTEEVLRYDAPVQHMIRSAGEPGIELAGVSIPVGAELVMLMGSANRDPLRFSDPDVFNPARPNNQSLSFGGGAHYCIAAGLARLEGVTAVSRLLARYPRITLAGTPVRADRHGLRGFRELPVTLGV